MATPAYTHGHSDATEDIPTTLGCSPPVYDFTVKLTQSVTSCRAAEYPPLYDRAREIGDRRAAEFKCTDTFCALKGVRLVAQHWDCDVNNLAYAELQFEVGCFHTDDARQTWLRAGLARPPAAKLGAPGYEPAGRTAPRMTEVWDYFQVDPADLADIACPTPAQRITFTYEEPASSDPTSNQAELDRYVERARNRARFYARLIKCALPCKPTVRTAYVGSTYNAAAATLTISVSVTIKCA